MIPARERRETDETAEALEAFARDLLILCKTFSVYPEGHPAPQKVAERLAMWCPDVTAGAAAIGITPSRLLFRERFFGSKGSRAECAAAYLHQRKIMRLVWTPPVEARDVLAFTSLLATTGLSGEELRGELKAKNVFSIDVAALDVARIHGAISTTDATEASGSERDERSRETWLWLQQDELAPGDLASRLERADFWDLVGTDALPLLTQLFRQGVRLDQTLGLMPEKSRRQVLVRLGELGEALTASEIGAILYQTLQGAGLPSECASGLLRKLDTKDLVEVLAALVALNGGRTGRLAGLFRHLVPEGATEEMLALLEKRLSSRGSPEYAREVWKAVETFLLDLDEERFFGDDYLRTLESIAQTEVNADEPESVARFKKDSETHVDWIYVSQACEEGGNHVDELRERLLTRTPALSAPQLVTLALMVHRAIPEVFQGADRLVQDVFSKIALNVRHLGKSEQENAIDFARTHEAAIIDLAANALIKERRIAGRRFLIELLSSLSADTTLPLLSKASHAPWYYVRNVATILGRRRERRSGPILQALLDHQDERVRKEALKSLAAMGTPARKILGAFAKDFVRSRKEREFAKRMLERLEAL